MKKYCLYGLIIESDVEMLQLIEADENSIPDVFIKQRKCANEVIEYLEKMGSLQRQYEIGMEYSCFKNKRGYYVIKDGREIVFEPKEGYTPQALSAWLLGYSFAMLLLQRRVLAIHCSAVCEKGDGSSEDVILIAGRSGAGKSSLTRKLLERNYMLMADDVAAVRCEEEALVYSAFPYQKLCRNEVEKRDLNKEELIYIDEDKDKFLVPVRDVFSYIPAGIKAMVYITVEDVPEVQIRKLSGLEQLMAVRENMFLTALRGEWMNYKEVVNLCLKMAEKCSVYVISRPRKGDSLDAISEIILGL